MNMPKRALCAVLAAVLVCAGVPASALQPCTAEATSYDVGFSGTTLVLDDEELDASEEAIPEVYVGGTGSISYVGDYDDESDGYEVRFESSDKSVLTISGSTYTVKSEGVVTVSAVLYNTAAQQESDSDGWDTEELGSYTFVCGKSTAGAALKKSTYTTYVAGAYGYESSVDIAFKNMPKLAYYSLSCTNSGSSLAVDASYKPAKKKVHLEIQGTGSSTVKVTLNDTTFKFKLKVKTLTLSGGRALIVKGKNKKLKLSASVSGTVKWTSSKKKVATVGKKGKVKAKKVGTTIVYAKVDGVKVGCAVSVVTAKRYKVIKRAYKIAKGTYSQAKRMQSGYYDCSSLVCRSYWQEGIYFGGGRGWAPVAASVGKWCVSRGKKIKGGCSSSNVAKLKLRAGDLAFQTGSDNGRYKGIYHVEMMTGYRWVGTYGNGKPWLLLTWANRTDGYSQGSGTLMARP